jgi:Uma2 family endonuclease
MFDSGSGFRMKSGNVRSPDLSLMRRDRLPEGRAASGFGDGAPDVCVEVISPPEDQREIIRKLNEYFESGAQQVWHIYSATRNVVVYSLTADIRYLGPDDELDGGELLPGFRCEVASLFDVG